MSRKETILSSLQDLKITREKKEQLKTAYDYAMREFNDLNELLLTKIDNNNLDLATITDGLRVLALDEFKETGEKQLTGGLGIRIMKKLEYDPVEAFKWAVSHKLALQLNRKEFEKVMNASTELPDWIDIFDVPSATIPKEIKVEEK